MVPLHGDACFHERWSEIRKEWGKHQWVLVGFPASWWSRLLYRTVNAAAVIGAGNPGRILRDPTWLCPVSTDVCRRPSSENSRFGVPFGRCPLGLFVGVQHAVSGGSRRQRGRRAQVLPRRSIMLTTALFAAGRKLDVFYLA